MADSVLEVSRQLNECLKASEEYQKYCLYRTELDQYPELFEKVQEFRRRNFEMQLQAGMGNNEAYPKLAEEYKHILENPLVSSYLNAELTFCKLSQRAIQAVCMDIDLQLDFL